MEWVSYKIFEKSVFGYVGLYFLCVMADVDGSNSDESDFQDEGENDSGSESDISVSTVNTEDLSDLSFSEDEDGDGEVGWSRDPAPVNTTPFTSRTGAISRIPEDGTAKDFFNLLSPMKCLRPSWKKRTATLDSALHINRTEGGEKPTWKK